MQTLATQFAPSSDTAVCPPYPGNHGTLDIVLSKGGISKSDKTDELSSRPEIKLIAEMEAMMTFQRSRSIRSDVGPAVCPTILSDKNDIFYFGRTLMELDLGTGSWNQTDPGGF